MSWLKKQGKKSAPEGSFKNVTHPSSVQLVPLAMLIVRNNANNVTSGSTVFASDFQQPYALLRPRRYTPTTQRPKQNAVHNRKLPELSPVPTYVALTAWPTYKLRVS